MGKRTHKAEVLTERDRALMQFIGQNGVASLGHLHGQFWTHARERTCAERLDELKKAGWIARHQSDVRQPGQPETVYTITPKGASFFSRPEQDRMIIGLPAHHELKQQLLMQDARIALEREYKERGFTLIDWKNERELRREQRQAGQRGQALDIADGVAVFVNPATGEREEIEIEADGQYYGKMLAKKIGQFRATGKPLVWATSAGARAARIRDMVAGSPIRVLGLGA